MQPVVTVCGFSNHARCYAEPSGRVRPETELRKNEPTNCYFLAMTLTATKSNWVKEDHWRESHLVADNGRLIRHQYMESSS